MKLYHGTDGKFLSRIMHQGIKPRGERAGNYEHTVMSNRKSVYLTDAYALHFAFNALNVEEGKFDDANLLVLEIDTGRLDTRYMLPDEDFLEQVGMQQNDADSPGAPKALKGTRAARTKWYRDNINRWFDGQTWQQSLKYLGTCQHLHTIPAYALTRAILVPARKNIHMRFVVDPLIDIKNYHVCAEKYRIINAKLFGDTPDPEWKTILSTEFKCEDIRLITFDGKPWAFERSRHVVAQALQEQQGASRRMVRTDAKHVKPLKAEIASESVFTHDDSRLVPREIDEGRIGV